MGNTSAAPKRADRGKFQNFTHPATTITQCTHNADGTLAQTNATPLSGIGPASPQTVHPPPLPHVKNPEILAHFTGLFGGSLTNILNGPKLKGVVLQLLNYVPSTTESYLHLSDGLNSFSHATTLHGTQLDQNLRNHQFPRYSIIVIEEYACTLRAEKKVLVILEMRLQYVSHNKNATIGYPLTLDYVGLSVDTYRHFTKDNDKLINEIRSSSRATITTEAGLDASRLFLRLSGSAASVNMAASLITNVSNELALVNLKLTQPAVKKMAPQIPSTSQERGEQLQTPAAKGAPTHAAVPKATPSSGNPNTTPSSGNPNTTPNSGNPKTTLNSENPEATPSSGNPKATPSSGNLETTPSSGNLETTPSSGNLETMPSSGNPKTTPSSGNLETTPSSGNPKTTPSSGNPKATPSSGNLETMPSSGNPKTTPSSGNPKTTLSSGNPKATLSSGNPKTTLSSGNPETTPSSGNPKTTSSSGNPETTPSSGNPKTTLSSENPINQEPSLAQTNMEPEGNAKNPQTAGKVSDIFSIEKAQTTVQDVKQISAQVPSKISPIPIASEGMLNSAVKSTVTQQTVSKATPTPRNPVNGKSTVFYSKGYTKNRQTAKQHRDLSSFKKAQATVQDVGRSSAKIPSKLSSPPVASISQQPNERTLPLPEKSHGTQQTASKATPSHGNPETHPSKVSVAVRIPFDLLKIIGQNEHNKNLQSARKVPGITSIKITQTTEQDFFYTVEGVNEASIQAARKLFQLRKLDRVIRVPSQHFAHFTQNGEKRLNELRDTFRVRIQLEATSDAGINLLRVYGLSMDVDRASDRIEADLSTIEGKIQPRIREEAQEASRSKTETTIATRFSNFVRIPGRLLADDSSKWPSEFVRCVDVARTLPGVLRVTLQTRAKQSIEEYVYLVEASSREALDNAAELIDLQKLEKFFSFRVPLDIFSCAAFRTSLNANREARYSFEKTATTGIVDLFGNARVACEAVEEFQGIFKAFTAAKARQQLGSELPQIEMTVPADLIAAPVFHGIFARKGLSYSTLPTPVGSGLAGGSSRICVKGEDVCDAYREIKRLIASPASRQTGVPNPTPTSSRPVAPPASQATISPATSSQVFFMLAEAPVELMGLIGGVGRYEELVVTARRTPGISAVTEIQSDTPRLYYVEGNSEAVVAAVVKHIELKLIKKTVALPSKYFEEPYGPERLARLARDYHVRFEFMSAIRPGASVRLSGLLRCNVEAAAALLQKEMEREELPMASTVYTGTGKANSFGQLDRQPSQKLVEADDDSEDCVICSDASATFAFIPCGHRNFCEACAKTAFAAKKECPCCRGVSTQVIPIFL
ncbi:hypothetical protein BV898_06242 [Hypsibius exemplaris]|uniref:RING-type domain-containing protein n=1 Tax=Hypsibius exemplaris TaxID=2072580 RepID=A0A1W0WWX3_HYPEX|nr:hypothetical protein BV898_06242 [Hypsibius exemplaris]